MTENVNQAQLLLTLTGFAFAIGRRVGVTPDDINASAAVLERIKPSLDDQEAAADAITMLRGVATVFADMKLQTHARERLSAADMAGRMAAIENTQRVIGAFMFSRFGETQERVKQYGQQLRDVQEQAEVGPSSSPEESYAIIQHMTEHLERLWDGVAEGVRPLGPFSPPPHTDR